MRHRSTKALFDYWNRLRGSRALPSRTEINPREIAQCLGDVFLIEGTLADFRFRLAGSRIGEGLGRALTGLPFETIWKPAVRPAALGLLATVTSEVEPLLVGIRAFGTSGQPDVAGTKSGLASRSTWPNLRDPAGRPGVEGRRDPESSGELLLLPLRHQGRDGERVLGALTLFKMPPMPREAPVELDIASTRVLSRAAVPKSGARLLDGEAAARIVSRHGHLMLIEGDRPVSD